MKWNWINQGWYVKKKPLGQVGHNIFPVGVYLPHVFVYSPRNIRPTTVSCRWSSRRWQWRPLVVRTRRPPSRSPAPTSRPTGSTSRWTATRSTSLWSTCSCQVSLLAPVMSITGWMRNISLAGSDTFMLRAAWSRSLWIIKFLCQNCNKLHIIGSIFRVNLHNLMNEICLLFEGTRSTLVMKFVKQQSFYFIATIVISFR